MKKFPTGEKLKSLRTARGLSQAELAKQTTLSLRTIQRIENNDTQPRGDSLLRLADVLNVAPEELTNPTLESNLFSSTDNNNYLVLLNLSSLSFIFFPLLCVFAPLVLWSLRKEMKGIDGVAKPLINFQLSWLLFGLALIIVTIAAQETGWSRRMPYVIGGYKLFEVLLFGMLILNIGYIIANTILLISKRPVIYQPAIVFFKN